MADYIYKSNYSELNEQEPEEYNYTVNEEDQIEHLENTECTNVEASTTLDELDQLEILNRHADEYSQIPTIDNPYPDVLKKPLFTKVLPDSDIKPLQPQPIKPRPTNFSELSIKDFASTIATNLMDILNDLLAYKVGDDIVSIFTKDTRLLSIGVVLVIISIFMIFFKNVE
jgi:hypothetical protein